MSIAMTARRDSWEGAREIVAPALLTLGLCVAMILGGWWLVLYVPLFVVSCLEMPAVAVAAVIVACALDRFSGGLGSYHMRPDELAGLALGVVLVVLAVLTRESGRGDGARIVRDARAVVAWARPHAALLLPLLAYWAIDVVSTLVSHHDVKRGIGIDLITLDFLVLYAAFVSYLSNPARVMRAVHFWAGVAAVEAVVGVLAFAVYLHGHRAVMGVQLDPTTHVPLVYGTLFEGNIFGSYMSAAFLLSLALALDASHAHKRLIYPAVVATLAGVILSNTRAAWAATAVGAVLLAVLVALPSASNRRDRWRPMMRLLAVLGALAIVVAGAFVVAPRGIKHALGTKAQTLLDFTTGSGGDRVRIYRVALTEWRHHPVLGLGAGTFTYRLPGDRSPGHPWIPNLVVQVLHDSGILGLAALLCFLVALYVVAIRALRRAGPGPVRAALAGLIAAVTALLIAFQATPGLTLGYSWALLALCAAAAHVAGQTGARRRAESGEAVAA